MFIPGADDGDDIDHWLQDALLMEGDNPGVAAWNWIMGMALNGAPGHLTGTDLTNRIGMPDLWFRTSNRDVEGKDWWQSVLEELSGPAFAIAGNVAINAPQVLWQSANWMFNSGEFDGSKLSRGIEGSVPVWMRNVIKTGRYASEGVNTWYGDPVVENLNPWQLFLQVQGFTPAEVSERYSINNRLKNQEGRITDRRKAIVAELANSVRAGKPLPEAAIDRMRAFNQEYPTWAITGDAIKQSARSRERASQRNEAGVSINPKLNDKLRGELAPAVYN